MRELFFFSTFFLVAVTQRFNKKLKPILDSFWSCRTRHTAGADPGSEMTEQNPYYGVDKWAGSGQPGPEPRLCSQVSTLGLYLRWVPPGFCGPVLLGGGGGSPRLSEPGRDDGHRRRSE